MAGPQSTTTVHTFCRYCLASCGVEVTVADNRVRKIAADKLNPHSRHDFCAKGRTAAEVVEHPRRIVAPMRRVGDRYVEASWDEALRDIADRMNRVIDADGPDAVGAYCGNPAGYSSSNLVFMNGWLDAIGTHNRYAVGSVDQNAVHVVAQAMYGSPLMVPVSDIDNCDLFLLVGANPAVSAWNWLESVPDGWRRALDRQRRGARIVVVDPVRTESADKADTHLAVRPGQDWALLLAMVKVILDARLEHAGDCADLATGMPEIRALVASCDVDDLADRCDIDRDEIEQLARDFAPHPARWRSPGRACPCRRRGPSPNGWATCSMSSPDGWIGPGAAGSNPVTSTRCDWPAWPRPHHTAAGSPAARWWPARTHWPNCPVKS